MAVDGVDLEALLAPLAAGEGGAGEDLRTDFSPASPYQLLRDARAEARAEERAQETASESEPPVPAGWREVKRVGLAVLAGRSKDFEVAAWTTEALVRLDGLPGLIVGARLITGLAELYWDAGFPRPDEDGWDNRAAPLGGLPGASGDGTLMQPLRRLALFRRPDGTPVGLHLWKRAEDVRAIADEVRRKQLIEGGVPDLAALEAEGRDHGSHNGRTGRDGGGPPHVQRVGLLAREASTAWQAMDAALTARFGVGAPSTRNVAEALARMVEIAERLTGALPTGGAPQVAEEAGGTTGGGAGSAAAGAGPAGAAVGGAPTDPGGGPRPLRTREDAIRQLEELAEFFRRTEPQSPLAYTLEDAARRARLPLPELLAEVLPDEAARTAMLTALGIRVGADSPSA